MPDHVEIKLAQESNDQCCHQLKPVQTVQRKEINHTIRIILRTKMGSTSNDAIDLTRQKKERKEVEYETVYTIGK